MASLAESKRDPPRTGQTLLEDPLDSHGEPRYMSLESATNLEAHLQQPLEDDKIINELIMLQTRIENHTATFYHKDDVNVSKSDLDKHTAKKSIPDAKNDATALLSLLVEPSSRATAIRIILARKIFSSIDFSGDSEQTLLPPAAVSLMSAFSISKDSDSYRECKLSPILI